MQSAALELWSKDLVGNVDKAQQTVFARARDNGRAAQGQWSNTA
jgi:fructose-bisphosphate aldolase class I